jgi:hypothetical protein
MVVKSNQPANNTRVISYIDGFNLYFGLRQQGWRKFMWLDLTKLSASVLLPHCELTHTKYFTSRVRGNLGKQQRQSAFLDAIATLSNLTIYWGRYQPDTKQCQNCGHYAQNPQEKKTDVNIATQIMCDAFNDRFDTALLISGDTDLVPPIEAVKSLFPQKKVVVAFPPCRYSSELATVAHSWMNIYRTKFRQSVLPQKLAMAAGVEIMCPEKWR